MARGITRAMGSDWGGKCGEFCIYMHDVYYMYHSCTLEGDLSYIEMHIQPVSKYYYAELLKYLDDMLLG